jgi:hypothetical protein
MASAILYGGAHDQCVGVNHLGGQAPVELVGRQHVPALFFAQQINRRRRDLFRNNNLHNCGSAARVPRMSRFCSSGLSLFRSDFS